MKKNYMYLLIVIVCTCLFIPKNVFAVSNSSKQFVDYRFFVKDNAGNSIEGLNFILHDSNNIIHYTSEYDNEGEYYYFLLESENDISSFFPESFLDLGYDIEYSNSNGDNSTFITSDFKEKVNATNRFQVGEISFYPWNNAFLSAFSSVPLILEEESIDYKKIVTGSLHYQMFGSSNHLFNFFQFSLVNNKNSIDCECILIKELWTSYWNDERCSYLINISDNSINYMRNAVFDYSDELWEELNNQPIASTEMSLEGSSVVINDDGDSVDLSRPSVIKFTSGIEEKEEENNSVIENIINPYTWNNGVVMLIIVILVIGVSSIIMIKKKS